MKKALIISGELVVIAVMLTVMFFFWKGCIRGIEKVNNITKAVQHVTDSTAHYRDLYNREHATRVLVETNLEAAKLLYKKELDSVAKALGTKASNVKSYTAISTYASGTLQANDVKVDTGKKQLSFSFKDDWIEANGNCDIPAASCSLLYQVRDSLIIATYRKRKNIFARWDNYIDAYSLNPHVRVNAITAFRVAESKPKRISIGPYAGYGYNGTGFGLSAGICLQFSLIRL